MQKHHNPWNHQILFITADNLNTKPAMMPTMIAKQKFSSFYHCIKMPSLLTPFITA
jgi:hypothetical protein